MSNYPYETTTTPASIPPVQVIEARILLRHALGQTIPSDDQIIIKYMRDAYLLLGGKENS